jgi:hypothetical protein
MGQSVEKQWIEMNENDFELGFGFNYELGRQLGGKLGLAGGGDTESYNKRFKNYFVAVSVLEKRGTMTEELKTKYADDFHTISNQFD